MPIFYCKRLILKVLAGARLAPSFGSIRAAFFCPGQTIRGNGGISCDSLLHSAWPHSLLYALLLPLGRRRFLNGWFLRDGLQPPTTHPHRGKSLRFGDAAFSLEVTNGQEKKTVEFLVDDDTKAEGKLKVGSQATVEYRSADGKNIAIHVVVKPASAFKGW